MPCIICNSGVDLLCKHGAVLDFNKPSKHNGPLKDYSISDVSEGGPVLLTYELHENRGKSIHLCKLNVAEECAFLIYHKPTSFELP